jgi:hypothetical protein
MKGKVLADLRKALVISGTLILPLKDYKVHSRLWDDDDILFFLKEKKKKLFFFNKN